MLRQIEGLEFPLFLYRALLRSEYKTPSQALKKDYKKIIAAESF